VNKKRPKVLIVKVGYSETLDPEVSTVTSYGDVLRTTVLLNLYKNDHVTWLVDEKAYPILKGNPWIDRILIYNLTSVLQLQKEHFDTVINLEKVPGICALADSVNAWRRYGFRFDVRSGEAEAYEGTENALMLCQDEQIKRTHNRYFEMVGAEWAGEQYVLGYEAKSKVQYDIGFNYKVGTKFPFKAWPHENWGTLGDLIGDQYSVSWQEGLENMEEYYEWINSCKLIITNDSFGMHVAIALKKNVIALFGPTQFRETHLYGLGECLYPELFVCDEFPCKVNECIHFPDTCMSLITPERVYESINTIIKRTEMVQSTS